MTAAALIWHISILAISTTESLYVSMAILVFIGVGFGSIQVFTLAALLRAADAGYRGRVISLRSLAIYSFAIECMSTGWLAVAWGPPMAARVIGIMGIILILILAMFTPKLRRL